MAATVSRSIPGGDLVGGSMMSAADDWGFWWPRPDDSLSYCCPDGRADTPEKK